VDENISNQNLGALPQTPHCRGQRLRKNAKAVTTVLPFETFLGIILFDQKRLFPHQKI
jgi:hypothetical protein